MLLGKSSLGSTGRGGDERDAGQCRWHLGPPSLSQQHLSLLARHQAGDWGTVPPQDAAENERSLARGFRIISSYAVSEERVWIITEADRSATTLLLPSEY
jgi:hypothetical protein